MLDWELINFLAVPATIVLLVFYWNRGSPVWGGFTIGAIVGLMFALISGFQWNLVLDWAALGTWMGFAAELLGKLSGFIKRKQ